MKKRSLKLIFYDFDVINSKWYLYQKSRFNLISIVFFSLVTTPYLRLTPLHNPQG